MALVMINRCRHGYFHVVNNDYTHWEMYAIGGSASPTIYSQGNRFLAPNTRFNKEVYTVVNVDMLIDLFFHIYLILLLIEIIENVTLYIYKCLVICFFLHINRLRNMKMHPKANGEIGIGDRKAICCWTELISGSPVPELGPLMQELRA